MLSAMSAKIQLSAVSDPALADPDDDGTDCDTFQLFTPPHESCILVKHRATDLSDIT
jgi:hypothetical protein